MADQHPRDRVVDDMLRRSVTAAPASASTPCVDGETLAAWSSGALATGAAALVEEHLADCARCQAMLAAFVRTAPVTPEAEPWWRRYRVRWLVPLATAATVAIVFFAIPARERAVQPQVALQRTPSPAERSEAQRSEAPPSASRDESTGAPAAPAQQDSRVTPPPPTAGAPRAALEKKEQSRGGGAVESDARMRQAEPARELAATAPPASPAPAPSVAVQANSPAVPSAAASSPAADSVTSASRFRAAVPEFSAPGSSTRWRIVGGQLQRLTAPSATWEAVTLPSATLTAGHAPTGTTAWIVGRAGTIFVTADGRSFERVPFPTSDDLASVIATNEREATVVTADGRRFRTTDRGSTWTPQ